MRTHDEYLKHVDYWLDCRGLKITEDIKAHILSFPTNCLLYLQVGTVGKHTYIGYYEDGIITASKGFSDQRYKMYDLDGEYVIVSASMYSPVITRTPTIWSSQFAALASIHNIHMAHIKPHLNGLIVYGNNG